MKTTLRALVAISVLLCVALLSTGCWTTAKSDDGKVPVSLIDKALNETLPRAHTGPAKFVWGGDYLKLHIEADGLKYDGQGWTYTWLSYRRELNVPWFTGLNYRNGAEVTLGKRPAD